MYHRIETVKVLPDYFIETRFLGGEVKKYDVKKLFVEFPQFRQFENDMELFTDVRVDIGGYGVSWNDDLDLDADTIWEDGILIEHLPEPSINHLLAYQLLLARKSANVTQKQLAETTGIYQADISKIERGLGNPSLATLNRLAEGLGMRLNITFENTN
ncbi:MAG: DUF2442 domain-containing protein [Lachnospiraceae bacterium]|nr:DUF2442 domain-containing protein [Lachnospiraceae bacterium]